jgi:pilus assembly protein CpaB
MNAKAIIPLALAVVLGLVAAILVRNAIAHKNAANAPATNLVSVVVAKHDLDPGSEIGKDDVIVSKVSADAAAGQVFSDPTQLEGRVLTAPIVKGQAILETLLAPSGTGAGLQALVPPGFRAMTMEVTEFSGVGGMLRPGCHIDVISVMHDDKSGQTVARTILQNVQISAVGHNVSSNPPPATDGSSAPPQNSNAITLLLTPRQSQLLQLALMSSRPWFVLRSTRDGKELPIEGTTMAELRGGEQSEPVADVTPTPNQTIQTQAIAPIPTEDTQPATIKRTVQIIRGTTESQVTFVLPNPRAVTDAPTEQAIPDLSPAVH